MRETLTYFALNEEANTNNIQQIGYITVETITFLFQTCKKLIEIP